MAHEFPRYLFLLVPSPLPPRIFILQATVCSDFNEKLSNNGILLTESVISIFQDENRLCFFFSFKEAGSLTVETISQVFHRVQRIIIATTILQKRRKLQIFEGENKETIVRMKYVFWESKWFTISSSSKFKLNNPSPL